MNPQTLLNERQNRTTKEFISYTKSRDPRSYGWECEYDYWRTAWSGGRYIRHVIVCPNSISEADVVV
ncbi:hypothetical protein [Dulcicalothrix desertica]|uniref:hypothetical protein n=1 Tax=Dulcicalothrix desertica TaxID=32056 RepID=UPI000F8E4989|nr:hypothetical protein [Dulcicalothrix desertica]